MLLLKALSDKLLESAKGMLLSVFVHCQVVSLFTTIEPVFKPPQGIPFKPASFEARGEVFGLIPPFPPTLVSSSSLLTASVPTVSSEFFGKNSPPSFFVPVAS